MSNNEIIKKTNEEKMENKEIVKKDINNIIKEASEVMSNITLLSRFATAAKQPFKVIDSKKMNEITKKVEEINEKIYIFSKSDTQVTRKLMTLSMLYPMDSIYRQLQQIAAQIERKQQALTENQARLAEQQIEYQELLLKLEDENLDELERKKIEIKLQKIKLGIANSMSYIEAAIKELGSLLEAYDQIKENKDIPDDWDEYDFEKSEIKTHIKSAFRNAYRDILSSGRMVLNVATSEYFEQYGIAPHEALEDLQNFFNRNELYKKQKGENLPFKEWYKWLNEMAEKYKDRYKDVCELIGLDPDNLLSTKFLLMNDRNKLLLEDKINDE